MIKETLKENWMCKGTALEDFKAAVANKDKTTSFVIAHPGDFEIASVTDVTDTDVKLLYLSTNKNDLFNPLSTAPKKESTIPIAAFESKGLDEELYSEFTKTQRYGFFKDGKLLFTSPTVDYSVLKLGGEFFTKPSFSKDVVVAEAVSRLNSPITLVCRTEGTTTKIFSLRSGKYAPIANATIFRIIDLFKYEDVGEPEIVSWEINNYSTRIFLKFPKKAKEIARMYKTGDDFVPGIVVETSDTGNCSFRCLGCFYCGRSCILLDEVSRRHQGDVNLEEILKEIRKRIFSKYTLLPKTMIKLLSTPLSDMSFTGSKLKRVYETYLQDIASDIGLTKAVGIKIKKSIVEQLLNEYIPGEPFTAYDLVSAFLHLPERLEGQLPCSVMRRLQICISKAPYFNFTSPFDEDEVILCP